jgi:polysaccharide deacetylase family protein (PEP-CTERM system associated)
MVNAFTVDVEEWFHVCGVNGLADPAQWEAFPSRILATTYGVLELADRAGVTGTFFVLGWIAERYPELVCRIRDAGHEIASHGHFHRRVYELGPEGFTHDLDRATTALTAAGSGPPRMFRAPEWSINDRSLWALDLLAAAGFTVDASMAPLRIVGNPRYPSRPHMIPTARGALCEVPPFVTRRWGQLIPTGGGWGLRAASPHRVLTEIEARNRSGDPVTLWLHPWEIDPDPPRMRLPLDRRFAHYFRLSGFESRLRTILSGAPFGTITNMLASIPRPAAATPAVGTS